MMSCFIYLDDKSNPVATQRFDSAPGVEIITPPGALYVQDASTLPTDSEILDHWRLAAGVLTSVAPNPGPYYYWDVASQQWVLDLTKAKSIKTTELKNTRDSREFGGFVWNGSVFDSDSQSQSRIQGAVQLALLAQQAGQPFSITWTLQDNTTRILTGTDMIQVGVALAQHVQALHETARILRAQVDSAENDQQLAAINWPI